MDREDQHAEKSQIHPYLLTVVLFTSYYSLKQKWLEKGRAPVFRGCQAHLTAVDL